MTDKLTSFFTPNNNTPKTTQTTMDNNFNNLSLVQVILKWKWHIIIITAVAAICGAIFSSSMFITPLYKSVAVAYPANISPYSDESETEQMLEIINSTSIMDSIIEKYDLWTDYKIDKNYKFGRTYMINEYRNDLHKQKVGEVVAMYDMQLKLKQQDIDSLKQNLTDLATNYGVLNYSGQLREVTRGFINGSTKANELKQNLEQYGADAVDLETKIIAEANTYSLIKRDYEQNLRFFNSNLTYSNIITEPFPADKKAFPVRWVVVALSALGALLLSIVVVFIIENRKRFVAENK